LTTVWIRRALFLAVPRFRIVIYSPRMNSTAEQVIRTLLDEVRGPCASI
jgi:hypothetical protein